MTLPAAVAFLPLEPSGLGVFLRRAGEGPEPFDRLESDGEVRAFRAELRAASGAVLAELRLELPGEEGTEAPLAGEIRPAPAAREEEWAAAHRDLTRLLAAPESFPELLLPAAAGELLPPLLFCATAERLFRIPCPRCFAPLATCRDDARLAAAGLPLFSAGGVRLLACPACAAAGRDERFYAGPEGRGLPPGVGSLDDLRRELGLALEVAGAAAARAEGPPPALAGLPCATCPQPGHCGAPAGKRARGAAGWKVFNLHDSPYRVTRQPPVPFDSFLERLGGRSEAPAPPAGGFLTAAQGSGVDAIEVLALKLAAFEQVVAAVRQHGQLLGRPHLDLHPGHLAVEPGPAAGLLPALWSHRVQLAGGSGSRLARLSPGVEIPLPPRAPKAAFASPGVRQALLAAPATAELLVERAVAEKGGELFRLEGVLLDPHGFFPPLAARDWLQLAWTREPLAGLPPVAARLDPRGKAESVEAPITTEPLALDPELGRRLGKGGGLRIPGVRYQIYPALGTAEDLYALGILLLRILVAHDGQSLDDLELLLDVAPRRERARGLARSAEDILAAARSADAERLDKDQIFARREDRAAGRPNAIPDDLWTDALLLALRLVTRDPVFGLPPADDAASPLLVPGALDEAQAQATELYRRATSLLFRRQSVHVEIQAAIAELLAEETENARAVRPSTDRL